MAYYFINPQAKNYVNELAGILAVDSGNLTRKLKELESEGVLVSVFSGNQKFYALNSRYPLLKELKKIFQSKYGLEETLKKRLKKLSGLKEAYLYGSFAKGGFGPESDFDLLLIGSHSTLEAQRAVVDLQNELQREINIVDLTEKDFLNRKKKKDEFIKNIFQEKIIKLI